MLATGLPRLAGVREVRVASGFGVYSWRGAIFCALFGTKTRSSPIHCNCKPVTEKKREGRKMLATLGAVALLSIASYFITMKYILEFIPIFNERKMCGKDMCKRKEDQRPVPEPMGVIAAGIYLIALFVLIPLQFWEWTLSGSFPHLKLLAYLSGLISICAAILLGFVDDMLDLRWRHKLVFPTLSSLPLLLVFSTYG
uniref:UDP-N-acetylglucosamine--dolichyl-phosphate N-acetylglucosaminephosphotransferase n=1 Tax=Steinernema glaseri TaxID=37863 RepID=A0A1I8AFY7_9BILA